MNGVNNSGDHHWNPPNIANISHSMGSMRIFKEVDEVTWECFGANAFIQNMVSMFVDAVAVFVAHVMCVSGAKKAAIQTKRNKCVYHWRLNWIWVKMASSESLSLIQTFGSLFSNTYKYTHTRSTKEKCPIIMSFIHFILQASFHESVRYTYSTNNSFSMFRKS